MTADEIAAMQADALAGTPGDWRVSARNPALIITEGGVHVASSFQGTKFEYLDEANARRIARVPRMEATITALTAQAEADQIKIEAQADEIERLRDVLTAIAEERQHSNLDDDENAQWMERAARAALVSP